MKSATTTSDLTPTARPMGLARGPELPKLASYRSFGAFLKAYVASRKRRERGFSFAVMARSLGLKGSSLLLMVARGERVPQPDLLLALCHYLALTPAETDYAAALVGMQRAKTAVERAHFSERLLQQERESEVYARLSALIAGRLGGALGTAEAAQAQQLLERLCGGRAIAL